MTLEAAITNWNEDRIKAAYAILNDVVYPYQANYGKNFPPVALVTGDNWIFVAQVQHINMGKISVDGLVIDW